MSWFGLVVDGLLLLVFVIHSPSLLVRPLVVSDMGESDDMLAVVDLG